MSETTKTAAKAASKPAVKKTVPTEAAVASVSVFRSLDTKSTVVGAVTMFALLAGLGKGKQYLDNRRLAKEIENATADGNGHRESRAS